MKDKTVSRIICFIFMLNVLFLIWAILWKCGVPFVGDGSQRVVNLIPFRGNTGWEMQFNVLLFVPFGFLLSALMPKSVFLQLLTVVSASFLVEIAQYVIAVGRSDITDLLLNTLGGAIGIGGYYLMEKIFSRRQRTVTLVVGVLIAVFELYISVSFILLGAVWLGFMMLKL